jgi:signal peptidase I
MLEELRSKTFAVILVGFFFALLIRTFVIEGFVVSGASMEPAIKSGDYIFVSKIAYKWGRQPRKSDVVVAYPRSLDTKVIKRVAGVPGERLEMGSGPVMLDPGEYFLLGDNRSESIDSRELGPVDRWDIKGKVIADFRFSQFKLVHFQ